MGTTTVKATATSSGGGNCLPYRVLFPHAATSVVTTIMCRTRSMDHFRFYFDHLGCTMSCGWSLRREHQGIIYSLSEMHGGADARCAPRAGAVASKASVPQCEAERLVSTAQEWLLNLLTWSVVLSQTLRIRLRRFRGKILPPQFLPP